MIIDSVEFHIDAIGSELGWQRAIPVIAIPVLWAISRKKLTNKYDVFSKEIISDINENSISLNKFVEDCLDYCYHTKIFPNNVSSALEEYVSSGDYYSDLKKVYKLDCIYNIPNEWHDLNSIFSVIDNRICIK